MGNQLAPTAPPLDVAIADFSDLSFSEVLGGGRFFRTLLFLSNEGPVVVKVYVKRGSNISLERYEGMINEISSSFDLISSPNVFPVSRVVVFDKAAYLLRQYFYSSLDERIRTRPFLTLIECKWVVYQMLRSLVQCHKAGVVHGDIKPQNFLVTSWNWVLLSDFAPYKPVLLPFNNPADFSFYFDTTEKRICYVAPERFVDLSESSASEEFPSEVRTNKSMPSLQMADGPPLEGQYVGRNSATMPKEGKEDHSLTAAMDVFSLGCVIAEVFLEGKPLFDLSSLLDYRRGTYDPVQGLKGVSCSATQSAIVSMLSVDPSLRPSPEEILTSLSSAYPISFFDYMHEFFSRQVAQKPETVIAETHEHLEDFLRERSVHLIPRPPPAPPVMTRAAQQLFIDKRMSGKRTGIDGLIAATSSFITRMQRLDKRFAEVMVPSPSGSRVAEGSGSMAVRDGQRQGESGMIGMDRHALDEDVETVDRSVPEQASSSVAGKEEEAKVEPTTSAVEIAESPSEHGDSSVADEDDTDDELATAAESNNPSESMLILASMICALVRNASSPSSRVQGIQVLRDLAPHLPHVERAARVVPYIVALLTDESCVVRSASVDALAEILHYTKEFYASDSALLTDFVLPALHPLSRDPDVCVRACVAGAVARVATAARRFVELSQRRLPSPSAANAAGGTSGTTGGSSVGSTGVTGLAAAGATPTKALDTRGGFDQQLSALRDRVADFVTEALTDRSPLVRRALVKDATRLCVFFGSSRTGDFLLPQLVSMVSDPDWELRLAFFESALTDEEEMVIQQALAALTSLCEVGLFQQKHIVKDVVKVAVPLVCHPNPFIRAECVHFLSALGTKLSPADVFCFILPLVRPFLRKTMSGEGHASVSDVLLFNEEMLKEYLLPPLTRSVYRKELAAALTASEVVESAAEARSEAAADERAHVESESRSGGEGEHGSSSGTAASNAGGREGEIEDDEELVDKKMSAVGGAKAVDEAALNAGMPVTDTRPKPGNVPSAAGVAKKGNDAEVSVKHVVDAMQSYIKRAANAAQARDKILESVKAEERLSVLTGGGQAGQQAAMPLVHTWTQSLSVETPVQPPPHLMREGRPASVSAPLNMDMTAALSHPAQQAPYDMRTRSASSEAKGEGIVGASGIGGGGSGGNVVMRAHVDTPLSRRTRLLLERKLGSLLEPAGVSSPAPPAGEHHIGASAGGSSFGLPPPQQSAGTLFLPSSTSAIPVLVQDARQPAEVMDDLKFVSDSGKRGERLKGWKPKNILVAHSHEHRGAVQRVAVSDDELFFASCSDDGTVKIWDCERLVRNVTNRSRATYAADPLGKVRCTDLAFCDHSHSLVVGCSDGSLSLVRIELLVDGHARSGDAQPEVDPDSTQEAVAPASGSYFYRGARLLRKWEGPEGSDEGGIVSVAPFHPTGGAGSGSAGSRGATNVVLYTTRRGGVHGWDLRMRPDRADAFKMYSPAPLGLITACEVSSPHCLCVTGTSRGFVQLWDLRFNILCQKWQVPGKHRIGRMLLHHPVQQDPSNESGARGGEFFRAPHLFVASGENTVTDWDLGTGACKQIIKANSSPDGAIDLPSGSTPVGTELRNAVRSGLEAEMLDPGAGGMAGGRTAANSSTFGVGDLGTPGNPMESVRAMLSPLDGSFLLTGGTDKRIRYWDLVDVQHSAIVIGRSATESQEKGMRYTKTLQEGISVVQEIPLFRRTDRFDLVDAVHAIGKPTVVGPRPTVFERIPVGANDCILDLLGIRLPRRMLVTAYRDGTIEVFK